MLATERQRQIAEIILSRKVVDTEGLSREFQVSSMTIRRDLERLAEEGKAQRVHGGAVAVAPGGEPAYQEKAILQIDQKQRIAQRAFELILPGESVLLTTGTTTRLVAERLRTCENHTIITNGVDIAEVIAPVDRLRTILLGGDVRRSCAVVGPTAERQVTELHYVDKLIMGVDGLSLTHGLTTHHPLEARLYGLMMRKAREVIVVADSSKVGRVAFCLIDDCSKARVLVTDDALKAEDHSALISAGLVLEIV